MLVAVVGTTDASISTQLGKVQEDENQQRGHEAQHRAKKEMAGDETWDFRPVMSDFCGLREAEEIYLIPGVKNFGLRCTDFEAGRMEKHACGTCQHCIAPQGAAHDQKLEQIYSNMATGNIFAGVSTTTPDSLLGKHREGAAARQAFELQGAYAAKGTLASVPRYLDYCGEFSQDEEYVICLLRNPHHTCWAWKPIAEPLPGEAKPLFSDVARHHESEQPVGPSTNVQVPIELSDLTGTLSNPPRGTPILEANTMENTTYNNSSQGADVTLVPGPFPLTESVVTKFRSAVEWILQIDLSDQSDYIRDTMIQQWSHRDAATIQWVQQTLTNLDAIKDADATTREAWRAQNQADFVDSLHQRGDNALAKSLRDTYDYHQANSGGSQPNLGVGAAVAAGILGGLALLAGAAMKNKLDQAASPAPPHVPIPPSVPYQGHPYQAPPPLSIREQIHGTAANPVVHSEVNPIVKDFEELRELDRKAEEEAAAIDPKLAAQLKLQNQAAYAAMVSNAQKMAHETSMNIIKNMSSNK